MPFGPRRGRSGGSDNLHAVTKPNKSLDASGGSVFRNLIGPAMLE
jgi:hypothetical protein